MSEEEKAKKENQKQEEQDASKKALTTGAKTAANAYAGPLAGKAVDLASKTKLGDTALNSGAKALNQNPAFGKLANVANKTGALDAADKAVDVTSSGFDSSSNHALGGLETSSKASSASGKSNFSSFFNSNDSTQSEGEAEGDISVSSDYSSKIFSFIWKHKTKFIPIIGGFLLFIFLIVSVVAIIGSPVATVSDFFSGVIDAFIGFFSQDQQEQEQKYYEKLKEVSTQVYARDGICIDVNLITATLTVNMSADDIIDDVDENIEAGEDSYNKMTKQVELLANMQIKRKKYGWDNRLKGTHCIDASEDEYELVDASNQDFFDNPTVFGENGKDSSTAELVARHDKSGFAAFFTKKVDEEKNYAYYIYRPAFEYGNAVDSNGNPIYNADGSVKKNKSCTATLDKDEREEPEISIGDLNTREDSVYYWNLVNSFIPEYYDEYLPSNEPERTEATKRIADDIYLLYQDIGPSKNCSMNTSYICRSDEGADFYGGGEQNITRKEFVENASPVAIDEMTRTGVFASITLAQAALESGNGSSKLSTKYANYYGMTAGSCAPSVAPSTSSGTVYQSGEGGNSCTGNAFWNGSVVAMCNSSGGDCQWYRIYDSFENSTRDHSRLLSERYECNVYSTYQDQLACIVNHGYATDPNYKNKIFSVINTYNLADYDIGTWDGTTVPVSENQFSDSLCYSNGAMAAGAFTSWKQYDPTWSKVKLGTSTVGKIGCAMTSVSIQIMRSGVSTSLGAEFNPGTFAQKMTSIGGFDRIGNIYWDKVSNIAPNFQFVSRTAKKAKPSDIANLISQGYYVILNVKYGKHWVAVDRVDGSKIYMFDPGSGGTEVGETYGLDSIMGYAYYRRG